MGGGPETHAPAAGEEGVVTCEGGGFEGYEGED